MGIIRIFVGAAMLAPILAMASLILYWAIEIIADAFYSLFYNEKKEKK